MNRRHHTTIAALLAFALGCQPASVPPPSTSAVPPLVEMETYRLRGVVREVDTGTGVVTIAHEEIPGFMKAMTMDFTPRDRSNLESIHAGDEVEGPLAVTRKRGVIEDYNLSSLAVVKAAPRTLTLDFGSGTATLASRPAPLKVGETVPDFAFTTEEGRASKLSDYRGKVVVMTFVYTRCPLPDYCPAVDRKFGQLAAKLSASPERAEAVRLLSISFDPEHDTPEALRKHAGLVGAKPPLWTYGVASHEELAKVAPRLGLVYGPTPGEIRHNLSTTIIGPDGRLARIDAGSEGKAWTPEDMMKSIISSIPTPSRSADVR